jgi:hypothetical protein
MTQKRTAWRKQEEQLVAHWNEATERHRQIHQELSARQLTQGAATPDEDLSLKARAVIAEIEGLRRQLARLKRQYLSGERY